MIKKRLSDRFDAVYLYDPALLVFTDKELTDYAMKGRNIESLDLGGTAGVLKRCKVPPTIFTCEPLKPKFQYLLKEIKSLKDDEYLPVDVAWQVMCTHVKAVKNCEDEHGTPMITWKDGGTEIIDFECEANIQTEVIQDIGTMIARKAGDQDINFSIQQGILWARRARLRMHHADDANTETASEKNTK